MNKLLGWFGYTLVRSKNIHSFEVSRVYTDGEVSTACNKPQEAGLVALFVSHGLRVALVQQLDKYVTTCVRFLPDEGKIKGTARLCILEGL